MIIYIIVILSVALILLLIDWQKVIAKSVFLQKIVASMASRPKRQVKQRTERPAKAQTQEPGRKDFFSGTPMAVKSAGQRKNSESDDSGFLHDAVLPPTEADSVQPATKFPELQEKLHQADIHFRKGELKAAEELYLEVAAKDPRCSKAYSRLGVIYLETGEDWQDAEEAFRQALKTDPDNGYILNNLGLVLYNQDKYADSIRQFELAMRQDEHNANRHSNLGKAYMAMRQYAKAESSFKRALKLEPNELEYKDLLEEAMEKKLAHKSMIRR